MLHNEFSRSAAFIFDESIGEISDDNVHAVLSESQVPAFRASRRANPAVKELALDLAEISFREDGPKAEDLPRSTKKRGSSSIACPSPASTSIFLELGTPTSCIDAVDKILSSGDGTRRNRGINRKVH